MEGQTQTAGRGQCCVLWCLEPCKEEMLRELMAIAQGSEGSSHVQTKTRGFPEG